ncbi:MAG: hypothetical protein HY680_02120 [Chloroflexi bacterium]|nr:hypothetical protein [Chloroflexota bacterium]
MTTPPRRQRRSRIESGGQLSGGVGTVTDQVDWVDPIEEIRTTISQHGSRIAALEEEIRVLKTSIGEEVIVLRTISRDDAKKEIQQLFNSGEILFYSDIVHRLSLDLPLVVELCQELIEEGEIDVQS